MDEHTAEMDYQKELLEAISELSDREKAQVLFGLLKADPQGLDYLDSRQWAWEQHKPRRTAPGAAGAT